MVALLTGHSGSKAIHAQVEVKVEKRPRNEEMCAVQVCARHSMSRARACIAHACTQTDGEVMCAVVYMLKQGWISYWMMMACSIAG